MSCLKCNSNNCNYHPVMYGNIKGVAKMTSYNSKLNDYWSITNIPDDIPEYVAKENVNNFLTGIVAFEVPSSLKCNLDCDYCYIREKWKKNTYISIDDIKNIIKLGIDNIINFNYKNNDEHAITSWGAEPLCNLDSLEFMIDECIKNKLKFSMSTNGTIVNDRVKQLMHKLFANGLTNSIQVSLDGPAEIHNLHRKTISGKDTFDNLVMFLNMLNEIQAELKIDHRLFTICGTLEINEDTTDLFMKSVKWFSDPSCIAFNRIIPIRLENSLTYNRKSKEIFIKTIQKFHEYAIDYYRDTGISILDFYTARLFESQDRVTGLPSCSAMRSQLAIDDDGSLYMCHGPITSTKIKPYTWFGNLFDGVIDYCALISNIDYKNSPLLYSAVCMSCPLTEPDITGSICITCPINNLLFNGNFIHYDHFRCEAFKECLPYFRDIHRIFKESELRK